MALCTGPVAVAQTTTMDYSYYDGTTDLTALTTKLSDLARQGKRTLARQQAGGDLRAKEILDLRGGAKA